MSDDHYLSIQHPHCINENVFTTDALNKNVLETLRSGVGGDEEIGFCAAKVIDVPNIAFIPEKKRTSNRQLKP